jgi:hypothetical protein
MSLLSAGVVAAGVPDKVDSIVRNTPLRGSDKRKNVKFGGQSWWLSAKRGKGGKVERNLR